MEPEDYPDEEPISEEEVAYAEAYAETIQVGAPEPDDSHLDPRRAARIRETLWGSWRRQVTGPMRRRA